MIPWPFKKILRRYKNYSSSKNDILKIEKEISNFTKIKDSMNEFEPELKEKHDYYTEKISSPEMAVSLEASLFLASLSKIINPKKVLDLGSGFSSFVLRKYSKSEVYSFDDDDSWLEKTRDYLFDEGFEDNNLYSWKDFENNLKFDLVFHDIGNMETRKKTLSIASESVKIGGVLVLDDVHKEDYYKYVIKSINASNFKCFNLYNLTNDSFGRFLLLLKRIK